MALEAPYGNDDDDAIFAPISYLSDEGELEPSNVLAQRAQVQLQGPGLETALARLDDRSKHIIESRWLQDDRGPTLHELAAEYGVSAERIRQIETAALKKLRGFLEAQVA